MYRHLYLGLITLILAASSQLAIAYDGDAAPSSIIAVRENGHTVFVNNEAIKSPVKVPPRRASVLVYWSRNERRWKTVPPPTASAIQAARTAAAEVAGYVSSQPKIQGARHIGPSTDPNYRGIARGYNVTTAAIDAAINEAAARHSVDPNLVRAMIKVESNFNPQAVSRKGAMGLMQLMPFTARRLNVSNPFDPQQNVDAGVRHLKVLLNNFGGDLQLTLAAYNAGEGAVARSNGVPHFAETQTYVKRITELYGMGGPLTGWKAGRAGGAPIRTFRSSDGVLHITNE
jgi:soluble lytic murein transglycosylase-like protein